VSPTASYTFTLEAIIGEPLLLIKLGSEVEFKPVFKELESFDFKLQTTEKA